MASTAGRACGTLRLFSIFVLTMLKVDLVLIGRTSIPYLEAGIKDYTARIGHYCRFAVRELPSVKNGGSLSPEELSRREGALFLGILAEYDRVLLLDEHGKEYTSRALATQLEAMTVQGASKIAFVIGGAYGFAPAVREKYPLQLSLSQLTFSHQLVRLIFLEQLYRVFTILRGEPYHHD